MQLTFNGRLHCAPRGVNVLSEVSIPSSDCPLGFPSGLSLRVEDRLYPVADTL